MIVDTVHSDGRIIELNKEIQKSEKEVLYSLPGEEKYQTVLWHSPLSLLPASE